MAPYSSSIPEAVGGRQLVVVSDLDGTLWDRQQRIPTASHEALTALRELGAQLVVATARGPHSSSRGLAQNRVRGVPVIALNGCIVIEADGTQRVHASLRRRTVALILGRLADHGLEPCLGVYTNHADQVVGGSPSTCRQHLEYVRERAVRADLKNWHHETPVFTMQIRGRPQHVLTGAAEEVDKAGVARIRLAPDRQYGGWCLTLSPPDVTKQSTLSEWLRSKGLGRAAVVAVGNGSNDLPLLRAADVAIAVETADQELLAEADAVISAPRDGGFENLLDIIGRLMSGSANDH